MNRWMYFRVEVKNQVVTTALATADQRPKHDRNTTGPRHAEPRLHHVYVSRFQFTVICAWSGSCTGTKCVPTLPKTACAGGREPACRQLIPHHRDESKLERTVIGSTEKQGPKEWHKTLLFHQRRLTQDCTVFTEPRSWLNWQEKKKLAADKPERSRPDRCYAYR